MRHDDRDAIDHRARKDVEDAGWHVVKILEEPDRLRWSFTVGLSRSFGHPEVIVFGLSGEVAHQVLNTVGELVRDGGAFVHGTSSRDVFEGFPAAFRSVPEERYEEWVGTCIRFYGDTSFPLLQLFWPDRSGRFPWEEGCELVADGPTGQPRLDRAWTG